MKKFFALLLAALLTLTACSNNSGTAPDDEAVGEVTLIGDYDKSALVDFDYSEELEKISGKNDKDTGNFLDDGYSEFKELYQKAYALAAITVSSPDSFPAALDCADSDDGVQLQVAGENHTYRLTGYRWDSFYEEMLKVFTKEQAEELIYGNKLFCSYDGALWYVPAAAGGDVTRVYEEYTVEKTDDTLDITRTSYHVALGEAPEFDPEKIDEYETKETHFIFTNTEDGWRASEFADVR